MANDDIVAADESDSSDSEDEIDETELQPEIEPTRGIYRPAKKFLTLVEQKPNSTKVSAFSGESSLGKRR